MWIIFNHAILKEQKQNIHSAVKGIQSPPHTHTKRKDTMECSLWWMLRCTTQNHTWKTKQFILPAAWTAGDSQQKSLSGNCLQLMKLLLYSYTSFQPQSNPMMEQCRGPLARAPFFHWGHLWRVISVSELLGGSTGNVSQLSFHDSYRYHSK